jgi:hypothetical protein
VVFLPVWLWLAGFGGCLAYVISLDIRGRSRPRRRQTSRPDCDLREDALRRYPEFGGPPRRRPAARPAPRRDDCRDCGLPAFAYGRCRPCVRQMRVTSADIKITAQNRRN